MNRKTLALFLLTLMANAVMAAEPRPEKENHHIYLLIGQSNMAGRAPFTEEESGAIDRCFLLDADDKWEPAKNPLNRHSTIRKGLGMQKMNPGYSFAKEMLANEKNITLGLVVNAKGGTSIKLWKKGTKFYDEAIRRTKTAQKSGTLKGVLWHQGEADRKDENYHKKLTAIIKDLRADLGVPDLPFVAGEIKDGDLLNQQLKKVAETVPATSVALAEGLTTMDRAHFDAKSIRLFGERYAAQMQKIIATQKKK